MASLKIRSKNKSKKESKKKKVQVAASPAKKTRKSEVMNTLKPRVREIKHSMHLLRKSLLGMVGLSLVLFVVLVAIFAPLLAPPLGDNKQPDPMINRFDLYPPKPPGSETTINGIKIGLPMGTGQSGEDIYYGVIWGARTSIYVAVVIVGIAAMIGIVLGALAGYYGGAIDEFLMRLTDVFLSIPSLILALAIVAILGKDLDNVIFALVITWWPGYARIVRGQILSIKENTYVEAANAVGAKKSRVLFKHIIPNSLSPLTVNVTMDMGSVVLVTAALSFIGFSTPGLCEWGRLVSSGSNLMFGQWPYPYPGGDLMNPWWAWFFPAAFIFIFVMGFNLLGDAIRDILDPRMRR